VKGKTSVWLLAALLVGLLILYVSGQVFPEPVHPQAAPESNKELRTRVADLESRIAFLEAQIKAMQSRYSNRVLTIPSSQLPPGSKIPPGAVQHDLYGIKYWTIPLAQGL
jgi:hypothetical protein